MGPEVDYRRPRRASRVVQADDDSAQGEGSTPFWIRCGTRNWPSFLINLDRLVRRLAGPTRDHGSFSPRRSGTAEPWTRVDYCIIKGASCPRAAKAYDDDAYVSLETLRAEIQAKGDVKGVYKLSGHALKHGVREAGATRTRFMQIDDGLIWTRRAT